MRGALVKALRETPWYGYMIVAVSFFTGMAIVGVFALGSRKLDENRTALTALCALRADLDHRIATTNDVLRDKPEGPIFGIPRKFILDSLANQQRTRSALRDLDC